MSFKYPKSGKTESQKPPERKKTKHKSKKSKNKHKNKTSYIQEEEDNSSSSNDIKSDIYSNLYDNLKEKYDIEIEGMDIDSKTEEKSDNTNINNKKNTIFEKTTDSNSVYKNNNDTSIKKEEQENNTNNTKSNIFINTKSKLQENISTNISSGSLYIHFASKKNKQNKNKDNINKVNNLNTIDFQQNMMNLNEEFESFNKNKNKKIKNRIKNIEDIFESDEEQEEIQSQFKNINFESGKQKQNHNTKEIINLFNQDNSSFPEPQTLTKSYFDIKGNLSLDNNNSNYNILKKSNILPSKNNNYTKSIENLNDLLNQTYIERQERKNLARKKLINSNRLKKYKNDKIDNFNTTDTLKKIDLLKQKINKEIPLKIEQFIPENYLQLLYKVQLPYWTNEDHSLNKLYVSEYFSVIKYAPVITNILQNSNIIKIRYINPRNPISENIVYSDLTFYNNIQIYSAGEYIGIKSFFNSECVVSNARVNMYYNENLHNIINHTIDKIFIYYGIMNMFYKAESYSNKKTENLPSKRTSLAMYCISCGLFMCPDHFKKYDHSNEDQPDPCSFYNNLGKFDFYYFLFNFRLYLDSVNNISKFFNDNLNKDTINALIESLAFESDTNEDLMESIFLYNTNNQDENKYKNIYTDKKADEEKNINNISAFLPILISKITEAIFKNEGMQSTEKNIKSEEKL